MSDGGTPLDDDEFAVVSIEPGGSIFRLLKFVIILYSPLSILSTASRQSVNVW